MRPRVDLVAPNVFAVRHPLLLTNSYIVTARDRRDEVHLIDAGIDADGWDLSWALARIGSSPSAVRGILLTHWHNDHTGGAGAMRALSGAPIYLHPDGADQCAGLGSRSFLARAACHLPTTGLVGLIRGALTQSPARPVVADHSVHEGDLIDDRFRVLETPGHERGHVSYYLTDQRILFAGDALAVCRQRLWFMSRCLTRDTTQARRSMQRCLELNMAIVCPGHRHFLHCSLAERQRAMRRLARTARWPLI